MIITFPQFEEQVAIKLYTNVKNVAGIKQRVIAMDPKYDYCYIDANNIVSLKQIKYAVFKTLYDEHYNEGKGKANSTNAQVLVNLSPNNIISDSLNRFGLSKNCKDLVVLKITKGAAGEIDDSLVDGEVGSLQDLDSGKHCDLQVLKKNYKVNATLLKGETAQLGDYLVSLMSVS